MCQPCWFGRVPKKLRQAVYNAWNAYQVAAADDLVEWIEMELARLEYQELADAAAEHAAKGQESAA